ncbi:MAG TPA: ABC transporter ATP-binding protein [Puia sp.]|nr:ABC transporter ATP-binding protein [Puia sp.]
MTNYTHPHTTDPPEKDILRFKAAKVLNTAHGKSTLDISFELARGRLLTIYGPSGAGKTTILRILAGLTDIDEGFIEADGEVWVDTTQKINWPARKRSVGFVFQDFALFPHLTVKENLEYAIPKGGSAKIVPELIEWMELTALRDQRPNQLSGGQQQRVALARAIARKPRILLLDEPLSALDDNMRWKLQDTIIKAHRDYNLTTILVSHHLPEIFRLSDEVICLDKGRIERRGKPSDIFLEEKISSKFKVTGEIIDIVKSDIVFIVSVLCANTVVKVIATTEEAAGLRTGQKVMVASKAFNPIILRME